MQRYIIYRGFAEVLANRLKVTTEELVRTRKELLRFTSEEREDRVMLSASGLQEDIVVAS